MACQVHALSPIHLHASFMSSSRQQLTCLLCMGQALRKAKNGVYCGPLRLLAMEVAEQLNAEGIYCNLLTGECWWFSPSQASC